MSLISNSFTRLFDLAGPLVIAPMGGGPTTPELVIATCNAGALGSLAAAYLSPEQIDQAVEKIKTQTSRAFAINLFTPMPKLELSSSQIEKALAATRKFRQELGLADPILKPPFHPEFEAQFEAVLKAKPRVFTFVFGLLEKFYLDECKKRGIYTVGTATTVEEALVLEASGVDAVIMQGWEAGAHRGIFSATAKDPEITTLDLTRQVITKIKIPVIAAGGLMTGQDIRQVLQAGAQAAMLGTAFLLCPESGTSKPYRQALKNCRDSKTKLTRAFSGRLARGIENRFMKDIDLESASILPFPAQNALTRDLRNKATSLERPEFLSLWAGTGLDKIRGLGAADLVKILFQELA